MIDNWIDGGIGGEARQQHDEGLSDGRRTHTQRLAALTPKQEAELAQVEREKAEMRRRMGLMPEQQFDELAQVEREKAEMRRRMGLMPEQQFDELVSWLLGPRPDDQ